jgi:hypothetical protein
MHVTALMPRRRPNGRSITFSRNHDLAMGFAEIFGLFILPALIILVSLGLFLFFKEEGE